MEVPYYLNNEFAVSREGPTCDTPYKREFVIKKWDQEGNNLHFNQDILYNIQHI